MALPVSDNFNRAALGANWTITSGNFSMPGSTAAMANALGGHSGAFWNADTFAADQYAEIVISNASYDGYMGVEVRVNTGGADTRYFYHGSLFEQTLGKLVAGVYTQLGNTTVNPFANGDVIRLEVSGTTLTAKQNGVVRFSVTDASIGSGQTGIHGYTSVTATNTSADSFAAGNLAVSVAVVADKAVVVALARDARVSAGANATTDKATIVAIARDAAISAGVGITADKSALAIVGRNANVSTGVVVAADKVVIVVVARNATLGVAANVQADKAVVVSTAKNAEILIGTASQAAPATAIVIARNANIAAGIGVQSGAAIVISVARNASISTSATVGANKAVLVAVVRNAAISAIDGTVIHLFCASVTYRGMTGTFSQRHIAGSGAQRSITGTLEERAIKSSFSGRQIAGQVITEDCP